jgi:hypothetical protein
VPDEMQRVAATFHGPTPAHSRMRSASDPSPDVPMPKMWRTATDNGTVLG